MQERFWHWRHDWSPPAPIGNFDPNVIKGSATNDFIWGLITGSK